MRRLLVGVTPVVVGVWCLAEVEKKTEAPTCLTGWLAD